MASAEQNQKLKNMITKKRKLQAIQKQIDSVSRTGPNKNIRFQDVINDAISKLKKSSLNTNKIEEPIDIEKVIEYLRNELNIDKRIAEFLNEI